MSVKAFASLYAAGKLRGDRDNFSDPCTSRQSFHVGHQGSYLRLHSAAPPAVEEYDAWLAANPVAKHGKSSITGSKLRRIVVMRRNGCSFSECGRGVGVCTSVARRWLTALPAEMSA